MFWWSLYETNSQMKEALGLSYFHMGPEVLNLLWEYFPIWAPEVGKV